MELSFLSLENPYYINRWSNRVQSEMLKYRGKKVSVSLRCVRVQLLLMKIL